MVQEHIKRQKSKTTEASGLLALQRELRGRFVSAGGRPADPAPTIRRLVTVKRQVWKELQKHAAVLARLGQRVTPGQLAAILLEKGVTDLRHPHQNLVRRSSLMTARTASDR